MEKPIEQQLSNLVIRNMSGTSFKIMKLLDGNTAGLSCKAIIASTGLPKGTVKSWIKNNLYREKKACHKITQVYEGKTMGQKYILSTMGRIIMEQLNKKTNTTMNATMNADQDIFSLLGVERKPTSTYQAHRAVTKNPAIAKYEELLAMIERKKLELHRAEAKLREMISTLSNLASVEQEICAMLGQPINESPKVMRVETSGASTGAVRKGGMMLNAKTASILAYIKEMQAVFPKEIAKAAGVATSKINTWVWNSMNSRGEKAYIEKRTNDVITLTDAGEEYLDSCANIGMSYPRLNDSTTKSTTKSTGACILALLENDRLAMPEILERLDMPKEKVRQWVYNNSYGCGSAVRKGDDFKYSITEEGKKRLKK